MKKIFVLDTSALVSNPHAYEHFEDADIILPIAILSELDNLKKQMNEAGKNARKATRSLDELTSGNSDIVNGIKVEGNCLLKIDAKFRDLNQKEYEGLGDPNYGDTQILACALDWMKECADTTLVSNDINLRMKAKSRGLKAITLNISDAQYEDMYMGFIDEMNDQAVADIHTETYIDPQDYELNLYPNEFVNFISEDGEVLNSARRTAPDKLKKVSFQSPWGLVPRNKEQELAINLLMDRNVDLCTIVGMAGSGKSLLCVAACLEQVINKKFYEKMIIYRPIQSVGQELGYLPGELSEKIAPHFSAIMDSFEVLFSAQGATWKANLEMYQKKGKIELDAITFIRGRSISNAIILLDEAQNLSKEDIKTLLTRAGEGTKIVITGDLLQIDNKNLDAMNNGLSYVIDKFKKSELSGHITLTQGERSALATEAAKLL